MTGSREAPRFFCFVDFRRMSPVDLIPAISSRGCGVVMIVWRIGIARGRAPIVGTRLYRIYTQTKSVFR
jgi:hypothetical protein